MKGINITVILGFFPKTQGVFRHEMEYGDKKQRKGLVNNVEKY